MKRQFTFAAILIAMVVLALIPVSLVNAIEKGLNYISGSDCDTTTFEYQGHTIAEGFAAGISADLPLIGGRITKIKFGCAVAGLGDTWDSTDGMNYYFKYTPYVNEMRVKVEGKPPYTADEWSIYDSTGTGGSSVETFSLILGWIGDIFTTKDIYDWLAQIYQLPPVAEWKADGHWSQAIVRQQKEFSGSQWVVNPSKRRVQTATAEIFSYFEEGCSRVLNVTAEAEIYLQIWDLWSGAIGQVYIGTYSVSFEVSLNPVCAMKTRTDGYFYVPNVATGLLKIEMLFDNLDIVGDQTGGTSPYGTIATYPDGKVDVRDVSLVSSKYGFREGQSGWDYMADVYPDRKIDIQDTARVSANFGKFGTYITDLAGVTITFNTGQTISPDSYGCVGIPSGATSFTVKRNATPIGAMIIFW